MPANRHRRGYPFPQKRPGSIGPFLCLHAAGASLGNNTAQHHGTALQPPISRCTFLRWHTRAQAYPRRTCAGHVPQVDTLAGACSGRIHPQTRRGHVLTGALDRSDWLPLHQPLHFLDESAAAADARRAGTAICEQRLGILRQKRKYGRITDFVAPFYHGVAKHYPVRSARARTPVPRLRPG